jgi:hypothetical protein
MGCSFATVWELSLADLQLPKNSVFVDVQLFAFLTA